VYTLISVEIKSVREAFISSILKSLSFILSDNTDTDGKPEDKVDAVDLTF
jgi:hypothetical protein